MPNDMPNPSCGPTNRDPKDTLLAILNASHSFRRQDNIIHGISAGDVADAMRAAIKWGETPTDAPAKPVDPTDETSHPAAYDLVGLIVDVIGDNLSMPETIDPIAGAMLAPRIGVLAAAIAVAVCDAGWTLPGSITTNGRTRVIPKGEPVFLIRGQDIVGAAAVRAWSDLAQVAGADPEIVDLARKVAIRMDMWPTKKVPDLPARPTMDHSADDTPYQAVGRRPIFGGWPKVKL